MKNKVDELIELWKKLSSIEREEFQDAITDIELEEEQKKAKEKELERQKSYPVPTEWELGIVGKVFESDGDINLNNDECETLSEVYERNPEDSLVGDEFGFYVYCGRVNMIIDGCADVPMYEFPKRFQEKLWEIVEKKEIIPEEIEEEVM